MGIYIFLVFLPLILNGVFCGFSEKNKKYTVWAFCLILLGVFVFRDYNVGRDIPGYVDVFERAAYHNWFDNDWIYMESGYIFLMKICSVLGISFRTFMLGVYTLLIIPLGIYIYRSSKDIPLSLIVYICYNFFVFNMSAFRQTAAMGLCLIAFMVAHKNGGKAFVKYLLLVVAATTVHKSAIVFLPAYFIMRQRLSVRMVLFYLGITIFAVIGRDSILQYFRDNEMTNYEFNESLTVGSSFLLTLAVVVFALLAKSNLDNEISFLRLKHNVFAEPTEITLGLSNYANLLTCALLLLLAFSGSILMRAATFYQISILIVIPNMLVELNPGLRKILRIIVIALMYAIFYYTVLVPSQFDIVPYVIDKDLNFLF